MTFLGNPTNAIAPGIENLPLYAVTFGRLTPVFRPTLDEFWEASHVPLGARRLIRPLLDYNPANRPKAEDILSNEYLQLDPGLLPHLNLLPLIPPNVGVNPSLIDDTNSTAWD
nr:expressed protein [Hymenolepis microstoma]